MPARLRNWVYAVAAGMVVVSGLCFWLVPGVVGKAIGIALVTGGLFGAFTFWFVELGMDEERERVVDYEKREALRHARDARRHESAPPRRSRFPRRP